LSKTQFGRTFLLCLTDFQFLVSHLVLSYTARNDRQIKIHFLVCASSFLVEPANAPVHFTATRAFVNITSCLPFPHTLLQICQSRWTQRPSPSLAFSEPASTYFNHPETARVLTSAFRNLAVPSMLTGYAFLYHLLDEHQRNWRPPQKQTYRERKGLPPRTIQHPGSPPRPTRSVTHILLP
jgi:hypothetical protein